MLNRLAEAELFRRQIEEGARGSVGGRPPVRLGPVQPGPSDSLGGAAARLSGDETSTMGRQRTSTGPAQDGT